MTNNTRVWLHGLAAALIGGGAASVASSFSVSILDSEKFNVHSLHGVMSFFWLILVTFAVGGTLNTMSYLKQSPLAPISYSVSQESHTETSSPGGEVTTQERTSQTTVSQKP